MLFSNVVGSFRVIVVFCIAFRASDIGHAMVAKVDGAHVDMTYQ